MRVPSSTYRLQLHAGFTFDAALSILDYLHTLGVGALYLSPILRAEAGSTHGYDVVDPTVVSPELGGEEKFVALAQGAHARGMAVIIDFVPNHMGIASAANVWWQDVLENGASSRFADFFDIDWEPGKQTLTGKVLLPILGDGYGAVLERGELQVVRDGGTLGLRYFERALPLAPRSLGALLERVAVEADAAAKNELLSVATALRNLPDKDERAPERRDERAREKEIAKRRLGTLAQDMPAVADALDREIAKINGSPDALDALLSRQAYRLSDWRVAHEAINYRRFFDVNSLAALRMEDPQVFAAMHEKLLTLHGQGLIDGVRLDHTDGLYDPTTYFSALRDALGGQVWTVAEKILEPGERLPKEWAIAGTTGYDYARFATGVLCDAAAESVLDAFARRFTGHDVSFAEWVVRSKRLVLRQALASELSTLARMLERIADADRRYRDITHGALNEALTETIAAFPVYRTYLRRDGSRQPQDDAHISRAIHQAQRSNPAMNALPLRFLHEVLTLRPADDARIAFVMRFQQLTGPAMAKAVEDTAFYAFTRFIAANEVGSDPAHIGVSIEAYHTQNAERAGDWPLAMTATATHDTKHGEDARARLAVLTEMPDQWRHAVSRWARLGKARKTMVDGEPAPSRNDEYLFYQAVLSAMPLTFDGSDEARAELADRMSAYMLKAAKEAKLSTSWVNPNAEYENALEHFVRKMLGASAFVDDLRAFLTRIAPAAAVNGLAQTALRLCAPGVPDTYAGCELWDQSLVDPDNRRPVDYVTRQRMLAEQRIEVDDGSVKLHVIQRLLQLRSASPDLFLRGTYVPIAAGKHVIAFAREHAGQRLVCLARRLSLSTAADASIDMHAMSGRYSDVLRDDHSVEVGEQLRFDDVFARLPVAVLIKKA